MLPERARGLGVMGQHKLPHMAAIIGAAAGGFMRPKDPAAGVVFRGGLPTLVNTKVIFQASSSSAGSSVDSASEGGPCVTAIGPTRQQRYCRQMQGCCMLYWS